MALAAFLSYAVPASASRVVLRADGSGDVPTFQAGADCVLGLTCDPPPDTLVVEPGVYAEDVFFDMSAPATRARVVCPGGPAVTRVRSIGSGGGFNARATIEGLQVEERMVSDQSGVPLSWSGCWFMGDAFSHSFVGNHLFVDCDFRGRLDVSGAGGLERCRFIGARARLHLAVFGLSIRDCVFEDCADTAVVATPGDASFLTFERCTFRSVDRAIVVNPAQRYHRDGLEVKDSRFEDVRYEAISFDSQDEWELSWLQFAVLRSRFTRCGAGLRIQSPGRIDLTMVADTLEDTEGPAVQADARLNWGLDSLVIRRAGAAAIVLRERTAEPLFRFLTRSVIEDNLGDGLAVEGSAGSASPRRWIAQNTLARNRGVGVRSGDGVTLLENLVVANLGGGLHLTPSQASGDSVRRNTLYRNEGAGLRVIGPSSGSPPLVYVENNLAVENVGAGIALEGQVAGTAAHNDAWHNQGGEYQGADPSANLIVNPLFCGASQLDFYLAENSPCAPGGPHGQIGALGIGCDPQVVAVVPPDGAELAIGRVAPNPLVGSREVTVSFTLPGAEAATMEVLDATGRRMSSRDLGPSLAGSQRIKLRMEDLPPGIYWVRVAQAGRSASSKVSILP